MIALTPFGFELPTPVIVLGLLTGTTYGLLAIGLILIYRTNRIINFAHGQIGLFGATVFLTAATKWHLPYYVAVPIGLAAAAGAGWLAELAVVRRLAKAPLVMSIVATLGVGQFLLFVTALINPASGSVVLFPSPPGLPTIEIGALLVTPAYFGMLIVGPAIVIGLTLFLRRSRFGRAMRAAAANADAARMAGVSVTSMSSLAWAIAGALAALTAILLIPATGTVGDSFGPNLLLRALAGAVIARMYSLPIAMAAGIGLGVIEGLVAWNYPTSSAVDVVLYGIILLAIMMRRSLSSRDDEKGSWTIIQGWRPVPEAIARLKAFRVVPWVIGLGSLAVAALLPLVVTHSTAVTLTQIVCFGLVGLSVGIITGLGGQLSLGQFALAAVGGTVSFYVTRDVSFEIGLLAAGLGAGLVSMIIGVPALRLRGVMLTVTTLGFAVLSAGWLLQQKWMLGVGVTPERPSFFGWEMNSGKSYYLFSLIVLAVIMVLVRNVRSGGVGRQLVAVRDNEDAARAFGISAREAKIRGFLLAGFVAGVGGAVFSHLLSLLGPDAFPLKANIDVVAMAVLGGMSLLSGPLLGALYIVAVPAFVPLDSAGLAATQLGWLVLILYLPGGISQGIEPLRNRYVNFLARRHGIDMRDAHERATETPRIESLPATLARPRVLKGPSDAVLLQAIDLHRSFGGLKAVNGVSLEVKEGEIVGLIGPNGAGKTTTFELIGGFTRPDSGQVLFEGRDITKLPPERRVELGLVRSFQDAGLFPTMTVLDVARLAFERLERTPALRSMLGARRGERVKDQRARELLSFMGLEGYRNMQIQELSTGTRRIVEIGCIIALQPKLVLLDEPSSGIAQRETEALGRLLRRIRDDLDLTMLVIEHDIPLIMGLSDRVIAMEEGRIIAQGLPEEVRNDPKVIEAYLGGSIEAIERSDDAHAPRPASDNGAVRVEEPL